MKCALLGALLLFAAVALVQGERIDVGGDAGWSLQEYDDLEATVGDVLVFTWVGEHNVIMLEADDDCDDLGEEDDDDMEILAASNDSPYELALEEPGTMQITSGGSGDCKGGMIFTVTVVAADEAGMAAGEAGMDAGMAPMDEMEDAGLDEMAPDGEGMGGNDMGGR